ncbi:MAG: TetR/AcrR family transcriptional regulator [Sporolactobacillus sp.]
MDPAKEKAILTAALHEFAAKDFESASTNQIAKTAGVSKGLVFHYYESKEKLYEACVSDAVRFTMEELDYENLNFSQKPLIELRKFCESEFIFCSNYPDITRLLTGAMLRPPKACSKKMQQLFTRLMEMVPDFFNKLIDALNLKEDVDRKTLLAVLQSHHSYYSAKALGYFSRHPEANVEEARPFVDEFLAMLAMSLQGLQKDE